MTDIAKKISEEEEVLSKISDLELTPRAIVEALDRYIVSQKKAKRAVAVAMRNRTRRMCVKGDIRDEITPKNILMIGPTGVGKTEISRRLAKLAKAPFIKVEASKFTEVGYVGRDVESIVRDLADSAVNLVREEAMEEVENEAKEVVEEKILNALLPGTDGDEDSSFVSSTKDRLKEMLKEGKLEERKISIEVEKQGLPQVEILGPPGFSDMESQLKDMFNSMMPKSRENRNVAVKDARELLLSEAKMQLIDEAAVKDEAIRRVQENGIVFIDEIDKVCSSVAMSGGKSPDVSREGVQRDLLPLVEGCSISTRYGLIRTDHILFIASGAFHMSKPSDLMPEFQGRFPIRVELESLSHREFVKILTEPKNALTHQYKALLATEGLEINFDNEAIDEIALIAEQVNEGTENIGARRLHTLLEKLLEDLSFSAGDLSGQSIIIDRAYVLKQLQDLAKDKDASRFIL